MQLGTDPRRDPALHIVEKFYGREAAGQTAPYIEHSTLVCERRTAYRRSPESVTLIRIHCTINLA